MDHALDYGFQMMQPKEIYAALEKERAMLIDLRSEDEYQKGHLNHARNLPYSQMGDWSQEIPNGVSLILYCEHGNLSLLAARKLRGRKGKIYTVNGGYQAIQKKKD